MDGPQNGWQRRTNPVHTMLATGTDAALGGQGFPHGFGGADDVIAMPLQCSTQWDGLGHIFDHGTAWNGRPAEKVRRSWRPGPRAHRAAGARPSRRLGRLRGRTGAGTELQHGRLAAPERDRRDRHRHRGFEVRPNEFDHAFQYEFWLTAAPLPITGSVGSPVNPIAVM